MSEQKAIEASTVKREPTLSGLQKAAIVLIMLGPADSAAILKHIPEEEADRVARAVATCDGVTADQAQQSLAEFSQQATSQQLMIKGGQGYAHKLLAEAYGIQAADRLIDRMMKRAAGISFDNFRKVDPQQLAKFIQDEHPQTIALILSNLDPSQAASLISSLPMEVRTDVAMRMADLDQISPEVIRNIALVIDQKLRNLGELSREAVGGVRAVANMFNRMDASTSTQLMDAVEAENTPLFENIRKLMFVFRDLEELDAADIRTLMTKVDRNTLLQALKGSNDSLRDKFLGTQSQRGADMMKEELANLGPVKLKDVDTAQQTIINLARELEKEGTITLKNSASDQYVY